MTDFFSLDFYREALRRLRSFALIAGAIFIALSALSSFTHLFTQIMYEMSGMRIESLTTLSFIEYSGISPALVMFIVPAMTLTAFSCFTKRNEADFYEAIPVSRLAMAVSSILAVLTYTFCILLLSSLLPLLVLIPCIGVTVNIAVTDGILEFFGLFLAAVIATLAATVGASVTGTSRNAVVVTALLLGAPRIIMSLINASVAAMDSTLVEGHIIPLFDNSYNLYTATFASNYGAFSSPAAYIYTALLSAAYGFLALLLFKKRKSEFATHSFASAIARHITRIALASIISLLGIYLICLDADLVILSVFLFVIATVVYFVYELATGRKEKVFRYSVFTFPIFICVNLVFVAIIALSSLALRSYSPSAEQIRSVSVVSESDPMYIIDYSEYVTLRSENLALSDSESRKIVERALDRGADVDYRNNYSSKIFKIKTAFGTAYRRLYVTNEESKSISLRLAENEGYKDLWLNITDGATSPYIYSSGVDLDTNSVMRVLTAMEEEIYELAFDKWYDLYSSGCAAASIQYTITHGGTDYFVNLSIPEGLVGTLAVFEAEQRAAAELAIKEIEDKLADAASGEGEPVTLNISTYGKEAYYEISKEIDAQSEDSTAFAKDFLALLSSEPIDYAQAYISVSLYDDSLFSEGVYADFSIPETVNEEELISFFKKYGIEY